MDVGELLEDDTGGMTVCKRVRWTEVRCVQDTRGQPVSCLGRLLPGSSGCHGKGRAGLGSGHDGLTKIEVPFGICGGQGTGRPLVSGVGRRVGCSRPVQTARAKATHSG